MHSLLMVFVVGNAQIFVTWKGLKIPMDIVKEIQDILEVQDNEEKARKLDELDWIVENGNFLDAEVLAATSLLLNHVLQEDDNTIKESMINTLWSLTATYNVSNGVDWDPLVAQFSSFPKERDTLIDSLEILGFSKNQKYLPVLETYLEDGSSSIQSAAASSIASIKSANHMVDEQ